MAKRKCTKCGRSLDLDRFSPGSKVCRDCCNRDATQNMAFVVTMLSMCGAIIKWCWNATCWCFKTAKAITLWGVAKYKEHQAAKATTTPTPETPKAE